VPREPRAERLDVAHPTREALDSTRPDAEEVARIHGPQLAAPLVSSGLAGPAIAAFAFLPRSWIPRGTPETP